MASNFCCRFLLICCAFAAFFLARAAICLSLNMLLGAGCVYDKADPSIVGRSNGQKCYALGCLGLPSASTRAVERWGGWDGTQAVPPCTRAAVVGGLCVLYVRPLISLADDAARRPRCPGAFELTLQRWYVVRDELLQLRQLGREKLRSDRVLLLMRSRRPT